MKRGFACGVFDLFHAGHVLMLQECRSNCDYLVVAINKAENIDRTINPGKLPTLFTFEQRKLVVGSCRYVDEVIGYSNEDELAEIMLNGNYWVRFLGDDYQGKKITAPGAIPNIHFIDRSHGMSTSDFKKKLLKYGI